MIDEKRIQIKLSMLFLGRMKTNSTSLLIGAAVLVAVGLIGYATFGNRTPATYDAFAQCLTQQGAQMYGAWWCPHCTDQKKMFGRAFDNVDYIECSPNGSRTTSQECLDAGIQSYPTWRFADGTELNGAVPLPTLAEKTGCPLPGSEQSR